jgi:hypothetical protein
MAQNAIIELQHLSAIVNKGLDSYISVHNQICNESATFMSLFKNIFGRGVSNEELLKYSENLKPEWINILNELEIYKEEKYSILNDVEADFFDKLFFYSKAVNQTIEIMIKKQSFLLDKSLNNTITSYENFEKINLGYEICITNYKRAGHNLKISYYNMISS